MNEWSLEKEGRVRRPFQQPKCPMVRGGPRAGVMQSGGTHSQAQGFHVYPHATPGRQHLWHCCWCAMYNATS